ncbi:MAG: hypothetical protein AAF721_05260 [Myxococcota bacterium]
MRLLVVGLATSGFGCGTPPPPDLDTCGRDTFRCTRPPEPHDDDGTTTGTATGSATGLAESGEETSGSDRTGSDGGASETEQGPRDDGDSADGGDTGEMGTVEFAECPEITAQSAYCVTAVGDGLDIIGIDRVTQCAVGDGFKGANPTSLGWIGDAVYGCAASELNPDATVVQIDLATGTSEASDVRCRAATSLGNAILVSPDEFEAPVIYDSFSDVMMGNAEPIGAPTWPAAMTAGGGKLYGAANSTDVLARYSMAQQMPLANLELEGFDDWVSGVSVVGDRVFLVTSSSTLLEFDANTGAQVAGPRPWPGRGIACRAGTG